MTIQRTLLMAAIAFVTLLSTNQAAKADHLKKIWGAIQQQAGPKFGGPKFGGPKFGGGWKQPSFPIKKQLRCNPLPPVVCPPKPPVVCPPTPPIQCYKYCVYYYQCHYGWQLYGCYYSPYQAQSTIDALQHQGYRARFTQVPVAGVGYPGGHAGHGGPFHPGH